MAVVTFVGPCNHQIPGGYVTRYGRGQYVIDGMGGFDWYLMLHMKDGKPGRDDEPITDPGPPVVIVATHPWM